MLNFKCEICGGEMSVTDSGELQCSYCGRKALLSDAELRGYKEFRGKLLNYLSVISDEPNSDETERIWLHAETVGFRLADGRSLNIRYLFKGEQDGVTVYTARNSAAFIFPPNAQDKAMRFSMMPSKMVYPSADIRDLSKYFPTITGRFTLESGAVLISVSKQEELYPLSAFGSLPPEHAAWITSRLENLCCALAYSGIAHHGISMDSVFINARTHEAFLLGGWWNSFEHYGGSPKDLSDLRSTAKRVLGVRIKDAPDEFIRFLNRRSESSAFDDFAAWDEVIRVGFHGRKFKKLDLSNLKI